MTESEMNTSNASAYDHYIHCMVDHIGWASTRPHVLLRPKVYKDGNQWCALYGEDIASGVAGFGDSPAAAAAAFDDEWEGKKQDKIKQKAQ